MNASSQCTTLHCSTHSAMHVNNQSDVASIGCSSTVDIMRHVCFIACTRVSPCSQIDWNIDDPALDQMHAIKQKAHRKGHAGVALPSTILRAAMTHFGSNCPRPILQGDTHADHRFSSPISLRHAPTNLLTASSTGLDLSWHGWRREG